METKSKKMLVIAGVIVIAALIVAVAALQSRKDTKTAGTDGPVDRVTPATTSPEVIPAAKPSEIIEGAIIAAPGASAITADNRVVTLTGEQTMNDVEQTSPLAPSESGPVQKDSLAASVIKLEVSAAGFSPNEFTVSPGAAVSISITGVDVAHALAFDDPSLGAIGIGVYKNETRVISFNAPSKPGEYTFYCNVGSHRSRGEVGKMIVK